jgi:hypothetical protein
MSMAAGKLVTACFPLPRRSTVGHMVQEVPLAGGSDVSTSYLNEIRAENTVTHVKTCSCNHKIVKHPMFVPMTQDGILNEVT